ncbi:hypothetical protein [uncultured Ilyobacter sp.]|uniref:hypothetical protein n=1 Tax=uncultured Ilyobacter sp. TaxID=544433 RepID=UPI0029C0EBDF|nr:hypothetical protein [uncultured Ilyobacter sp.]
MKKILMSIFIFVFSCAGFSASSFEISFYVPSSLSGVESDALSYIKDIGGISLDWVSTESTTVWNAGEGVDDVYKIMTYLVTYSGDENSWGSGKLVLYYEIENTTATYDGEDIEIDEEERFMLGTITLTDKKGDESKDAKSIAEREYITYDAIGSYTGSNNGIPANMEYSPDGAVTIIASPVYDDPYDDESSSSFMNGNVITHIFEATDSSGTVLFPTLTDNGKAEKDTGSSDTWKELAKWLTNNVAEDTDENGTPDVNEDSDPGNDRTYSSSEDSDDKTYTYLRPDITTRKYVYFVPGTATSITPPASVIDNLEVKSRTTGSNRQRTSSIKVGADDYYNDVKENSDPSPFMITEMEERGK